jgi:hypothetical protein
MKCGYRYIHKGVSVQIVCNDNKKWYRREALNGDDFGAWKAITAPTVIRGQLKTSEGIIFVTSLVRQPDSVPTN